MAFVGGFAYHSCMVVGMEIAASGSWGCFVLQKDPGLFLFFTTTKSKHWVGRQCLLVGTPHTWLLTWWEWN